MFIFSYFSPLCIYDIADERLKEKVRRSFGSSGSRVVLYPTDFSLFIWLYFKTAILRTKGITEERESSSFM